MQVKCINNDLSGRIAPYKDKPALTVGKTYEVIEVRDVYYHVMCDDNITGWMLISRFEDV